ncbi:uncharacterized protein C8Q71DRAFT_852290 [Rhodofomes roseus]|uniref:NADP-dependent 3-hydroxy acid dehydrogenase YdfG n=1 Tax=Rhodofomes roseus TaxID=34475 RepID=A0ABQ8KWT9_9APHY|nr:uncharacterized protein C8Q71DRAFT_852290 [Rhodofomes roseus]KAH9843765.1 hypothetical protein C8Q71DRAFT_852290 [Rhodofomes roseus]
MSARVWFVTGSSTGIGRATTELVLQKGDIVVATLRKPEVLADLTKQYGSDKLLVLKLDVAQAQEIKDTFAAAIKQFGRIDVVLNNAGYAVMAEVEGTPDDAARTMFEVNFWGAANVTREAVRVFRDVNRPVGGRLLQVSSAAGIRAPPTLGYYGAAKHALNGLTGAIAAEVSPDWNIKFTNIEPSLFRTPAIDQNVVSTPLHPAYAYTESPSARLRNMTPEFVQTMPEASEAASRIYRLSTLEDPPAHLPLGKAAVRIMRDTLTNALEDANKYGVWSDDLSM